MSDSTKNIADIRQEYLLAALDEATVGKDPLAFFKKWFDDAVSSEVGEANAMTLATVDKEMQPHARIVLLKGLEQDGFVFYTNYDSDKGHQIADNPRASIVFFWKELERQVRIEGRLEKTSAAESDHYFHSRPKGSQLGAWSSPQSKKILNRDILEEHFNEFQQKYPDNVPRPEHWGGYRLMPHKIEFWQGRGNRMHDRIVFEKLGDIWDKYRVAP